MLGFFRQVSVEYIACFILIWSGITFAKVSPQIERIGGDFIVSTIKRAQNGGFIVEFRANAGSPRIRVLRLESDHVNAGLNEGDKIRLSADVVASKGDMAEVAQMVLYLPSKIGPTPVWMLSKRNKPLDPPAKLIEMHAPATDYAVF
jgi:hypothetical protein